ncbi:HprK-related kinase B [Desulfococcus sp.]|uniref:HprK-related kinase B n=1 Tax=Desulfococcus sp. TaxID=2025834 RepID=UPI0035930555
MWPKINTRKGIVEHLKETWPAGHDLDLFFGGCAVRVRANDLRVIEALDAYYSNFVGKSDPPDILVSVHESPALELPFDFMVKAPDPGKTKIKEEFLDLPDGRIVRKRLTGMIFVFGDGDHAAVGPCLANLNQVVNFINNRYIEWLLCKGCLLGHAAGIIWQGKGLALAGFSGAGKSTLALHIMTRGAAFVSNDRLMVEARRDALVMYGVAKLPRINPGTILNNPSLMGILSDEEQETFQSLSKEELWELEHKFDAPIDECFGSDLFILNAPMVALAILNWTPNGAPTTVQKVDMATRPDLLPAFMKSTGLFFVPGQDCRMPEPSAENYASCLSRCDVLEFSGGVDFHKAAEACLAFLDTGRIGV